MKKSILIIFTVLVLCIIGLMVYSNNKITNEEFYSPYEIRSYVIKDDNEISFDIYSKNKNSIIMNTNLNSYTIYLDNLSYVLEDIRITSFDVIDYSIIRIYSKMPPIIYDEYSSNNTILQIKNSKFTLNLSYSATSFLKEDKYPLLSISKLHGTYSYIDGALIMSGINISLTNNYSYLKEVRIGEAIYGNLSLVEYDTALDNIVNISEVINGYNPKKVEVNNIISVSSKDLFIPLGYKNISLFRSGYLIITLDNKTYYIDCFDYMTNAFEFNDYKSMMRKGEIIYA